MPDNNRKVLSDNVIRELNSIYTFEYDKQTETITTNIINSNRRTKHDANKSFLIFSKKLCKKFEFTLVDINFWKLFMNNEKLSKYSLFDIHNSINKLKIMYQPVNEKTVTEMLLNNFYGIQRIN